MPFANAKLYKKKAGRPKKGYTKTGAKKGRPVTIRKIIQAEISRNAENKTFQAYDLGANIYPVNHASFPGSIIPISPASVGIVLSQGTGQGNRVGNTIKIKKLSIKGTIHPLPYNATTNAAVVPTQIKFWFFYDKESPTTIPNPLTDFFQFGNTVSAMQNDLVDLFAPINKDRYKVFKTKTFKIGFQEFTTTGTVTTYSGAPNNDFKLNGNFSFNLTKYVPKTYKFRDNLSEPTTRGIYMMVQAISAIGTQFGSTTIPAQMSYIQNVEFEDA